MDDRHTADVDVRVETIAADSDPSTVAIAFERARDHILGAWLVAAARQPFHLDRPDQAVADGVPVLFDAIVAVLRDVTSERADRAPMDDERVSAAATKHAQDRFSQGLGPVAIVTEFRLLRQEMGRALRDHVDDARPDDVVAALVIVGDAIDGAATIGLTALSDQIETLRETFLATTVHDVRQPMTLVQGHLRLAKRWIRSDSDDRDRISEAIDDALVAADELVSLVDTLSDAGRIAMGALEPSLEPASLEAIVRGSIETLGAEGRERIHLTVAPGPHLIGAWDPLLLHRLVANLISNGLKYSPPGTPLHVDLDHDGARIARMRIRDEGMGMTPDELTVVFDRFARTDRARASGTPGHGLGLYACRGIVLVHGGEIVIASDGPGQGSVVTVTLPLLEPDDPESPDA